VAINFNINNVILVPRGYYPDQDDLNAGNLSSSSKATLSSVPSLFPNTTTNLSIIFPTLSDASITTPAKFKEAGKEVLSLLQHLNQLNPSSELKAGLNLLEEDDGLKALFSENRVALQQA